MSPTREQVLQAFARIEQSGPFKQSERLRSFLQYIVIETLEGRANRIKSYSVGLEVFGRQQGFDATNDAIVRTTAIRLRDALDKYYRIDGNEDPVIISLPKGRYVPEFSKRECPRTVTTLEIEHALVAPRHSWRRVYGGIAAVAIIAVAGFLLASGFRQQASADDTAVIVVTQPDIAPADATRLQETSDSFASQVVEQLVRIGTTRVVGPVEVEASQSSIDQLPTFDDGDTVILLSSSWDIEDNNLLVHWRLVDGRSGVIMWASVEQVPLQDSADIDQLAGTIAFKALGTEGALPLLQARLSPQSAGEDSCISSFQRLAIIFDEVVQADLRSCLEEAAAKDPADGEIWALLSQLYYFLAESEASFGRETQSFVDLAESAATKAQNLAPDSFQTQRAALYTAFGKGRMEDFERIARDMLQAYPGDPNLKVRIGARLVRMGRYDEGRRLAEEGVKAKGGTSRVDYLGLALADYGKGAYDIALRRLERAEPLQNYFLPLLEAVTYAELGEREKAEAQVARLLEMRPNYGDYLYRDLSGRHLAPMLIEKLAASLKKVGLTVEDL